MCAAPRSTERAGATLAARRGRVAAADDDADDEGDDDGDEGDEGDEGDDGEGEGAVRDGSRAKECV